MNDAVISFDTLKFVTRLENGGFTRQQAQTEAEALAEIFKSGSANLATKQDLKELGLMLAIRLGSIVAVATGIIIAIMRLPQ